MLIVLAAAASLARAVDGFPLFGFAAVLLLVAALAAAAPIVVRLASRAAAGTLARYFGAAGRLAAGFFGGSLARNAIAVASLAMALGMTLAMIVTVSSIRETVRVWVETTLRSDLWVKSAAGGRRGIVGDLPAEIVPFLQAIPGVAAVDPFRAREAADERGRPFTLASGDFRVVARIGGLPLLDGRDVSKVALEARERDEILVSEPFARRNRIGVGDHVPLATPRGSRAPRVAGIYRDYSNDRGTVLLDRELFLSLYGDPRVTSVAVAAAPGVDAEELRRRVRAAAQGRFALSVSTNRELRREVLKIFDQTFAVTRALEAIAVAVAILGIANALAASAVERRRSFGLLRAIGGRQEPGARRDPDRGGADRRGRHGRIARRRRGLRLSAPRSDQPAVLRLDGRRLRPARAAGRNRAPRPRGLVPRWNLSRLPGVRRRAGLGARRRMRRNRVIGDRVIG